MIGPKVERLAASATVTIETRSAARNFCSSRARGTRQRRSALQLCRIGERRPGKSRCACPSGRGRLTWTITKLRFPKRKT